MCLHSHILRFITSPFPTTNTHTGPGDKECTHSSPSYTTSHFRRGNWKEEEKGVEHTEVRGTVKAPRGAEDSNGEWMFARRPIRLVHFRESIHLRKEDEWRRGKISSLPTTVPTCLSFQNFILFQRGIFIL